MGEVWVFLLTVVVTIFIGIATSFTGGGGGLIGVPYLILIGLDPIQAIGTGKVGGLAVAAGSIPKYLKADKIDKSLVYMLLPITLVASVLGPQLIFNIPEESLEQVLGVIILLMAPVMLFKKKNLKVHKKPVGYKLYLAMFLYFIVATIQAAFGSGTGTLLILVLMTIFGLPAINAGATRRAAGIPLVTITVFIFALGGHVVYLQAAGVAIGNYIGSRVGTKIALKKGNEWVTYALIVLLVVMGVKLLVS